MSQSLALGPLGWMLAVIRKEESGALSLSFHVSGLKEKRQTVAHTTARRTRVLRLFFCLFSSKPGDCFFWLTAVFFFFSFLLVLVLFVFFFALHSVNESGKLE